MEHIARNGEGEFAVSENEHDDFINDETVEGIAIGVSAHFLLPFVILASYFPVVVGNENQCNGQNQTDHYADRQSCGFVDVAVHDGKLLL